VTDSARGRQETLPAEPRRPDAQQLGERLEQWASELVVPGARISGLAPMPGNAGLSFGFDVVDGTGTPVASLVIRLAPPGVRRTGNTDVLRQVPLLHALNGAGIPVAPLVWSTADPTWFGTDVIVQRRLSGKPLHMTDPAGGVRPIGGDTAPYLERAMHALAAVHDVDWQAQLGDWEPVHTVAGEVAFWRRLLGKMPEPEWAELGEALADACLATDPGDHRIGVFHGDYQTNNILFAEDDGSLEAIIDWEISGLGPVGLDVGWFSMMTDPGCWNPARVEQMQGVARPAQIRAWYEQGSGRPLPDFDWYRAFAYFRYGVIAGFNLRLHRTGRRIDAVNEITGYAAPVLFRRGLELVRA
jgi:aminoglycoside phosphotransferase (APT) family kinase protein